MELKMVIGQSGTLMEIKNILVCIKMALRTEDGLNGIRVAKK